MPTVQGKGFSADFSDPWAQRIVAVGLCSVGVAVALTIHKSGGLKLIVENAPKALAAAKVIKG